MSLREKILGKIIAVVLAVLLVFNPLVVPVVWAEGEEPPTETQTEPEPETSSQVETTTPESSDGGDSTITTGDAESLAEVETTANTNVDCVPGEISAPEDPCVPPEGETECSDDVEISHDNTADVADEANSVATTGDNQITGALDDALIDTGDATAGASLENKVNTNVVVLEDSTEAEEEGIEEETVEGEESEEESNVEVEGESESGDIKICNHNEGDVTNEVDVLASTGENLANENGGDATVESGDALAYTNLLNLLNTNLVGSNFELYFLNLLEGQKGNIDLGQIWDEIIASGGAEGFQVNNEDGLHLFVVQNSNLATLENEVDVSAESGGNQANENQGKGTIHTGDATALANVVNLVNLNLIGSKFFLGVINIFGDFEGDLILPRPEKFVNETEEPTESGVAGENTNSEVVFSNQNQVEVNDSVTTTAETGNNQTNNNQAGSLIETGDAQSQANSFSLLNTNIQRNNWFFLIINSLGSRLWRILGWSAPEANEQAPESGPVIFQVGGEGSQNGEESETQTSGQEVANENSLPENVVLNQNEAQVANDIQVSASTGQNQANENQGGGEIKTGKATALANLFNFVNLNILGGRWFMGLVNVLGSWTGNTIFAYPDVTVSLSNGSGQAMVGETTEFSLLYKNQGYDEANNVVLRLDLPEGLNYLGDSSGLTPGVSGRIYTWDIGKLGVGEGGSFAIQVEVDTNFSFDEPLSFWSKIIPQVQAAENQKEKEILVTAFIVTPDSESDSSNNNSSARTLVYLPSFPQPESSTNQEVDQRQPVLEISAWNNVGEFVYPGDTVTFEIKIRNTGEVPAYDVYLSQTLYNGVPEDFGVAEFEIGKIEAGKGAKLSFGLKLADNGLLPATHYYTIAQAFGKAPNGNEVSSNEARTNFEIRWKEISSLFDAKAVGKEEEVLGSVATTECPKDEDILPYVLLFILSSLYLVNRGKIKLGKTK